MSTLLSLKAPDLADLTDSMSKQKTINRTTAHQPRNHHVTHGVYGTSESRRFQSKSKWPVQTNACFLYVTKKLAFELMPAGFQVIAVTGQTKIYNIYSYTLCGLLEVVEHFAPSREYPSPYIISLIK